MVALFRLVEPSGGAIIIDGVDISGIGLEELRSRIAIIPQETIVLAASLRDNVDPFHTATDEEVAQVLRRVHLGNCSLDMAVSEGGGNLSLGERQLLCIARALLRKPRVLVLDEATSSIDATTDAAIQTMLRECFRETTVLTIAHRLNTIADSDRVLVLDDGRVAEFDSPAALLRRSGGVFAGMVGTLGETEALGITRAAEMAEMLRTLRAAATRASPATTTVQA